MNGAELATEAGITYRQLDYWCREGLVVAVNEGSGSGRDRAFAPAEVRVAIRMARMVRDGMTVKAAAVAARRCPAVVIALQQALEECA